MHDQQNLKELKSRFEIPGIVRVEPGNGGSTRLVITTPQAAAEIYLHGAHVTHYQPAGQKPVLWMSQKSQFEPGKPIRGGVPVCFPWFGPRQNDPQAPGHGFVRLRPWNLDSVQQDGSNVIVTMALSSDEATRKWWPTDFVIRHIVTVGSALEMKLQVQNTSKEPIHFEEALHTYFTVGDIKQISVQGLGGVKFIDKVDGAKVKDQSDPLVRFTGETDRVYLDTQSTCIVDDPATKRKIEIAKSGSNSTVVWNPWINKAKAMPDFGDDEWPGMMCVETTNVGKSAVEIKPGVRHEMVAKIRLSK